MSEFIDEASVSVRGGDGGAGVVSFRREAHVPRGGPDGGDGAPGGDVWLVADAQLASLVSFHDHPHRRAPNGTHGKGRARHGAKGADLRVPVPVGTIVKDTEGQVLADLVAPDDTYLAASGGRGGRGNARFLSNRRRAPSFAEQGEPGEERWLRLELKLFADVALIGLPNAGKSTLISRISAARPKVADYPFTTLRPHLGVVRLDDHEMVVADIPGLVEGASEGKGLGDRFLRHIERARVLLVLLDLAPADPEWTPERQERVLLKELGAHRPELLERPRLVIGTKVDVVGPDGPSQREAGGGGEASGTGEVDVLRGPQLLISAVTGARIPELLGRLAALVDEARANEPEPLAFTVHRPEPEGVTVARESDGTFVVRGRDAERAVAVNDLTDSQALAHVHDRLRRIGVDRALARAGARPGDSVRIGRLSFDYDDDQGTST